MRFWVFQIVVFVVVAGGWLFLKSAYPEIPRVFNFLIGFASYFLAAFLESALPQGRQA